jgi:hypothetical protein
LDSKIPSIPQALFIGALVFWARPASPQVCDPDAIANGDPFSVNCLMSAQWLNSNAKPLVQLYGAKCDSNGSTGNGTDDTFAFLTAAEATATTGGFLVNGNCRIAQNATIAAPISFESSSSLVVDSGKTVTINGAITASTTRQLFAGNGTVTASTAPFVSVAWWGALTAADPAAAFRAAVGSNRIYFIPAVRYTFQTVQARAANGTTIITNDVFNDPRCPCTSIPYKYVDPPVILFQHLSNFSVDARGATFFIANSISFSTFFMFDGDSNFTFQGGIFIGNRSGLSPKQESSALATHSDVNFALRDVTCAGNWGGISACVNGDWLVNGKFDRFTAPSVGICFDMAFMKQVTFDDFACTGADANGNAGAGQVGLKAWSVIWDPPAAHDNHTGVSFTETDGVTVTNSSARNFVSGPVVASGTNIFFRGNTWRNNPGLSPNLSGIGLWITTITSGHAPSNIKIQGDKFIGNGTAQAGWGIFVNPTTHDTITNLSVTGNIFNDNASVGIDTGNPDRVTDVVIEDNICLGANQTTCVGGNIASRTRNPWRSR